MALVECSDLGTPVSKANIAPQKRPPGIRSYVKAPPAPAFTLIELLAAVTIIGVLAALLLMAVKSVRLKAQRVQCLNNVRQLSLGSFMYAQENSRHAGVETAAFPGGNWMGTLNEYAKVRGLLVCPSAPLREPSPASGNEQGYADRAWVRWTSDKRTMFHGSYGYNGYLYSDLKLSEEGDPKQKVVFTRECANSPENMCRLNELRIVNQVAIGKGSYGNIRKLPGGFPQHGQAFFQSKSVSLIRIHTDRHCQSIEQSHALLNHPEMPDGKRIETPRVDPCFRLPLLHSHDPSVAAAQRCHNSPESGSGPAAKSRRTTPRMHLQSKRIRWNLASK
jgi:prepilin-type N-terminal cleavage/methylation domain-containing protein